MNAHLAEISSTVAADAQAVLVLDGAGWQSAKAPRVPDTITLLPLPPHAPNSTPIENVRADLRANRLAMSLFETYDATVVRCCEAWNVLAGDSDTVRSITGRDSQTSIKGPRPSVSWGLLWRHADG